MKTEDYDEVKIPYDWYDTTASVKKAARELRQGSKLAIIYRVANNT